MDEKCKEDNLSGPTPDAGNDAKTRCQIMNGFSVSVCDVKVCLNNYKSYFHECPPVVVLKSQAITKPLLLIASLLLGD